MEQGARMGPQRRSGRGFCTCIRTAACHQQQLSLPVVRVSIGDKDEILDLAGDVPRVKHGNCVRVRMHMGTSVGVSSHQQGGEPEMFANV
jgi:hypothetical protein